LAERQDLKSSSPKKNSICNGTFDKQLPVSFRDWCLMVDGHFDNIGYDYHSTFCFLSSSVDLREIMNEQMALERSRKEQV
jgi:nitrous oxide reductase